ncbi:MAG TPA: CHRD domain-containing protein [Blastocatellia bacterium]|nr:CHRD domain-containing protein [Blastocatellia bacterium]
MRRSILLTIVMLLMTVSIVLPQGRHEFKAVLVGDEEVPAISTVARGEFRASINRDDTEISYELRYSELEGNVAQAHIHFGQHGVNGGITVFLCTNLGNGPAGTQPCPPPPARISGTIRAGDMVNAASGQGIAAGEFAELIRAIRAGLTYVNVHSDKFPGGEIRSQIHPGRRRGGDDDGR